MISAFYVLPLDSVMIKIWDTSGVAKRLKKIKIAEKSHQ